MGSLLVVLLLLLIGHEILHFEHASPIEVGSSIKVGPAGDHLGLTELLLVVFLEMYLL